MPRVMQRQHGGQVFLSHLLLEAELKLTLLASDRMLVIY